MDEEVSEDRPNPQRRKTFMARHPELCFIVMALSFSYFSKYSRSTPRVSVSSPPPHKFFPFASQVIDFHYGNIDDVVDLLDEEEVLFVMYYAPWCAKSMQVRLEFERAAKYLQDDIRFVAVNCWYSKGKCRLRNKFLGFPVLYLYHNHLEGFRYTGVLTAEYIIRFVWRLLYPLTYISSQIDLVKFLVKQENAVIGFFDFNASPQPPGYHQFYLAAMRSIEKDPRNMILFAVVTRKDIASSLEMKTSRTAYFFSTLNESREYPKSWNFTSSAIIQWIFSQNWRTAVKWILPTGTKSIILSTEIEKGPAVLLFTPHVPLAYSNQHFELLREIALDYNNCFNSTIISDVIDTSVVLRLASLTDNTKLARECKNRRLGHKPQSESKSVSVSKCCSSIVTDSYSKFNSCDVCLNYEKTHLAASRDCASHALSQILNWKTLSSTQVLSRHLCAELMPTYDPSEFLSLCCDAARSPPHSHYTNTDISQSTDPYIRDNTGDKLKAKECQHHRFQRLYNWLSVKQHLEKEFFESPVQDLKGSACLTNRSLNFYAMNIKSSQSFAQRLGVLNTNLTLNKSFIVLIDKQKEMQYVMKESLSKKSIVQFIHNYSKEILERHFRSTQNAGKVCADINDGFCIVEVTSNTFQQTVMDKEKDVVILYYTPWCAFCASFAHIYLALARYFRSTKHITFARINADANDLPWMFSIDAFPSVVIYPAHRKDESIAFPDQLPKTLPNLIKFVLRSAAPNLKLETGLSVCSRSCIHSNLETSARRVHELHREIHILRQQYSWLLRRTAHYQMLSRTSPANIGEGDLQIEQFQEIDPRLYPGENLPDLSPIITSHSSEDNFVIYVEMLQRYVAHFKQIIHRKELQQKNARQLHSALRTSKGFYIEKHKLVSIVKKYEIYRSALLEIFQPNTDKKKSEITDELLHTSPVIHDEL